MTRPTSPFALVFVSLSLTACPNGGVSPDSGPEIDAGPDGGEVTCELDPEVGILTPDLEAGRREQTDMPGSFVTFARGPISDGSSDFLFITLWDNYGAFSGGMVAPGTYPIVGVDTNFVDCGLCVYLLSDFDDQGTPETGDDTYTQVYMAQSGTVVLDSVSGNLVGSIDDMMLRHVTVPDAPGEMSTDHSSGCRTRITSATFDAPITEQ